MEKKIRDLITGELTLDYFMRRSAEGWKISSVEWVREAGESNESDQFDGAIGGTKAGPLFESQEAPYGLQLSSGGQYLEENPLEATVLILILEQIVKEKRVSEIALQLNREGYRTRDGGSWSPTAVFNLLPRMIEAGPSLLKSTTWQERRSANLSQNRQPN